MKAERFLPPHLQQQGLSVTGTAAHPDPPLFSPSSGRKHSSADSSRRFQPGWFPVAFPEIFKVRLLGDGFSAKRSTAGRSERSRRGFLLPAGGKRPIELKN